VSVGSRLPLFVGFAMIIISELFTLRRNQPTGRIAAGAVPVFTALSLIPLLVATEQIPLAILAGFWLLGIAEEVYCWQKYRRLT
jgi:hypothetical protein